ncbi:hypothetical protein [Microbacterium trichothecenolyticum]|uniref:hypothetical protein n=1 Tax=Microbacterium trichothecenolyticum TaxID=69370 RepID=UPI000B14A5C7|nr:hypothetical protein [Microbacterium trichothecenolyticum]
MTAELRGARSTSAGRPVDEHGAAGDGGAAGMTDAPDRRREGRQAGASGVLERVIGPG